MYKTVRHGENSLQYTILPQTEEVLNNSGLKGKGRDYSPSIHVRRTRRKSTVKYVLLIVFGVIFALALASVPLYVMNGALFARRSQDYHDLITATPSSPSRDIVKSRKKELKISPDVVSTLISKLETTTLKLSTIPSPTVTATTLGEKSTTPPWTMPALRSWKSSTSSTTNRPYATEDSVNTPVLATSNINNLENDIITMKPWDKDIIIRPTATAEPITLRSVIKYYTQTFAPVEKSIVTNTKTFDDVLITTKSTTTAPPVTTEFSTSSDKFSLKDLKDTMLSVDDDEEFKESLEVDEVFSLPSLKPDSSDISSDSDEVTVSKANDNMWYEARWPFVDTSSYFQWTGYSPGDNLLLPLLVAALSSVALVLLLALAVKRRKRSYATTAQIGLTADLQADDNTNLLTAENAEDAEE